MAILQGDVKFVTARVMADTTEGGGAPTANEVTDGASNEIFDDISELDRAIGDVSLRKVFLEVETDDTDTFLGANVCIAAPPDDPNVSVSILQVNDFFAEREDAKTRLESYLAPGSAINGYLFGNMLAGQQTVVLLQRDGTPLPNISDTLFLTKFQGLSSEFTQAVRITAVSSYLRTFDDAQGVFERREVTLEISDVLLADFPGFPATRTEPTPDAMMLKTGIFDSVVADAVRVYGTVPLTEAAEVGDFTIKTSGIYVRVVPSAQVETPIADAQANNESAALVPTGAGVSQTTNTIFSPTQALYIGARILPGSLTIVRGAITLTDNGGRLEQGGSQVGTIDYDNGVAALTVDVFGTGGGSHVITFTPAATQTAVNRSAGIPITANNRSLSYVFTFSAPPARGSLSVSYLAGGRWYVLRDDGSGAVRGSDSAFGIGNLNQTTGTITLTLGALPDVGSALIFQWAEELSAVTVPAASLRFGGKFFVPINTDGDITTEAGERAISPGKLVMEWNSGGVKTAEDDGFGALTGDATGLVDYQKGVVYFAPNVVPARDTVILLKQEDSPGTAAEGAIATTVTGLVWAGSGSAQSAALGSAVTPGTLTFGYTVTTDYSVTGLPSSTFAWSTASRRPIFLTVTDDGSGNLKVGGQTLGTVNYGTGALNIDHSLVDWLPLASGGIDNVQVSSQGTTTNAGVVGTLGDYPGRTVTLNNPTFVAASTASFTPAGGAESEIDPVSVILSAIQIEARDLNPNHALNGVSFDYGGKHYRALTGGAVTTDVDPLTGTGTTVGTLAAPTGLLTLTNWPSASNVLTNWRAVQSPPVSGDFSITDSFVTTFRTAAAPLRNGSFTLLATMSDGTAVNVTADVNGKINGTRVKGVVDYETGVVDLVFVSPTSTAYGTRDVSYFGISGVTTVNLDIVKSGTIRYNVVSYSYIPLDATIIGINPVRLPSDGRVPIIRKGSVVVVGNTATTAPATVSNAQTIDLARERLSRVKVRGADGNVINTGYTTDLDAGEVTFTDVTGYSQPVTIEHRIEDMALVSDAQINGEIVLTRPLTHDYGTTDTYVSSALLLGDMAARYETLFDQASWNGTTWSDNLSGDAATGTFNDTLYPIEMTNAGAVTERWAIRFTNPTTFQIIGEHVGVIGTGTTNTDTAPVNPNTATPYFTIPTEGWGVGWATGNILRFNTVGAMAPVWLIRTVQQGPEAGIEYSFNLLARGDVDRP